MSTSVHYKKNFFDFFPTPKFLEMSSVGIDISDQAVRFVQITRSEFGRQKFHLKKFGEKKIGDDVISSGFINKPEEIKRVLTEIHKENHFDFANISLPEEKGYLFKTELPNIADKYIAENIEFRLEENVPLDASKSVFDYSVIKTDDTGHHKDAVVTVVPNKVIDVYSDLFQASSLIPISYELITQSVACATVPKDYKETCMIIHVGDARTGFGIVSDGALQFTSTVNIGRVINQNDIEKKRILIKDEIVKLIIYWQNHADKDKDNKPIKKVIISGKEALESGLKECLADAAGCPVELANPWVNVFNFDEDVPAMSYEDSLDYAPAIGLALLNFYHA